jgi:S1-C subfamily serine protease
MALAREAETIVIQGVLENSPAEKAGLRTGDVVVSVGGQAAGDLLATVDSVRRQMPGSDLRIRVLREGKEKEVSVRVAVFPFSLLGILGNYLQKSAPIGCW